MHTHEYYVDNSLFAKLFNKARTEWKFATSIEAISFLLGNSDLA
jgi:hypothetical protein